MNIYCYVKTLPHITYGRKTHMSTTSLRVVFFFSLKTTVQRTRSVQLTTAQTSVSYR